MLGSSAIPRITDGEAVSGLTSTRLSGLCTLFATGRILVAPLPECLDQTQFLATRGFPACPQSRRFVIPRRRNPGEPPGFPRVHNVSECRDLLDVFLRQCSSAWPRGC